MVKVVDPTTEISDHIDVFLAGTIEMGNSPDWQQMVIKELSALDIVIANPRRGVFDDFSKEEVHKQINWELDHLKKASIVFVYFHPNTISPISLLELGLLLAKGKNIILCCPDGYNRKDNVMLTTEHSWSSSPTCDVFENLEEAVNWLRISVSLDNTDFCSDSSAG